MKQEQKEHADSMLGFIRLAYIERLAALVKTGDKSRYQTYPKHEIRLAKAMIDGQKKKRIKKTLASASSAS